MELWIRSQDKRKLVKVNEIYTNIPNDFGKGGFGVYSSNTNFYEREKPILLGVYSTKERALEVLDEIQNFICIEIHENNINYEKADLILKGKIVDSLCKIYQMPKE